MGKILAKICLEGFDGNKEFNRSVAAKLSPEARRRLLDEVIFYKIFFVDLHCQEKLDPIRYECLFIGMEKTFRGRLSAANCDRLNDKLLACSEIPFDEYLPRRLTEQAGLDFETVPAEVYANFKFWFPQELAGLQVTIGETVKFLNAPPSEQKAFLRRLEQNSQPARKKTSWGKWLTIAAVAVIALFAFNYNGSRDASPKQNRPAQTVSETVAKPAPVEKPEPIVKPKPVTKPKPIEPVAKIGVMTGYDYDHPILNDDGLCEFTVDNTRNDMPVYARIWDVTAQLPVRAFTIAQGDKFIAENLSPGTYEVRYMELYENDVTPYGNKSEPITLEQYGTSYSTVSLTLYKVYNGNTTTTHFSFGAKDPL